VLLTHITLLFGKNKKKQLSTLTLQTGFLKIFVLTADLSANQEGGKALPNALEVTHLRLFLNHSASRAGRA
jgi:hypothetical protein